MTTRPWGALMIKRSGEFLTVERIPVVEIVQIDGIANGSVVGTSDRLADARTGFIGVDVAGDGGIEGGNGFGIQLGGVGLHPGFGLHVGGLGGDEGEEGLAIDADAVEHHLIIALAAAGIIGVEFAGSSERGFLPETGKVKNTEGACGATADGGNDGLTHIG